jgi:hypothetical protein
MSADSSRSISQHLAASRSENSPMQYCAVVQFGGFLCKMWMDGGLLNGIGFGRLTADIKQMLKHLGTRDLGCYGLVEYGEEISG